VPYAAGGTTGLVARSVGQKISELLKQPVIIENKGGAGGNVGMDSVAKASPDGYTIGLTSSALKGVQFAAQLRAIGKAQVIVASFDGHSESGRGS
jgi:tripartite-type tricarboxylate transporter receptor subunit TctC